MSLSDVERVAGIAVLLAESHDALARAIHLNTLLLAVRLIPTADRAILAFAVEHERVRVRSEGRIG